MSYILEALKKSERERKQGKVPNLETFQDQASRRRHKIRPFWPFILLGSLLLGGVFLGAWFYWREPAPTPSIPLTESAPDALSQSTSIPAGDSPATQALPKVTGKPELSDLQRQTAQEMNQDQTTAITPELATSLSPPAIEEESPAPPEVEDLESAITDDTAAEDQAEVPSSPPTAIDEARIVKLENLPADLKDELPAIKIGVHLYSKDSEARRASINGRLMREGQQVGSGLYLEEITRQGVILSFRGRKFSVEVFPR
jgi:general secretion pathway protein B